MQKKSQELHSQGKTEEAFKMMNDFCFTEAHNTFLVAEKLIRDLQEKIP